MTRVVTKWEELKPEKTRWSTIKPGGGHAEQVVDDETSWWVGENRCWWSESGFR